MLRLVIAFLLPAALGIHAYYNHKREGRETVSARRWMYGLYAAAFLLASIVNYVQLLTAHLLGGRHGAALQIGYSTFILMLSYGVVLAGVKRKPY